MHLGQKLSQAVFLVLLIGAMATGRHGPVAADLTGIAASATEIHPLGVGERAPSFTVRTVDDRPFIFDPGALERPVVLITFRGGWCPYCNMHLSELRTVVPTLASRGIDVYFLSGDRPELLYSSLKRETQEDIDGLGYTILSDADIDAARALGIAFLADPAYIARRDAQGDIDGSSMKNFGVLPVPAVFVIDTDGRVTYAFVEPDYKVRLPANDLLEAVETLAD